MELKSFLADKITVYAEFRQSSGRKSTSYLKNIKFFDHYLAENFASAKELTQEMADSWCACRPTEHPNSCISRIYPIISLVKFLRERGLTDIVPPKAPRGTRRTYIPHAFTDEELAKFFSACDNIKPRRGLLSSLQRITIPVFFRLLYSSGIRTTEAILLRADDVDLKGGILSIKAGKGYNQHHVVLHDSMLHLLLLYDRAVSTLVPDREYFFPTHKNGHHQPVWVTYHFRVLWKSVSKTRAIPYELRHNYAVENINRWRGIGFGLHDKLLALGKSMGHSDFRSTMGYYSLTPAMSEIVYEADSEAYETIIPDLSI